MQLTQRSAVLTNAILPYTCAYSFLLPTCNQKVILNYINLIGIYLVLFQDCILTTILAQPEETRRSTLVSIVRIETEYQQLVLFATAKGKFHRAKPCSLGNQLINTKCSNKYFFYPLIKMSSSEGEEKLLLLQLKSSAGGRKKTKFCYWRLTPPPRMSKQPPERSQTSHL